MGNILQTMHDLGLTRYEDFLAGPGRMRRPSAETMDAYRSRFTRASWEYQTAQANMQFQGRRVATSLWDTLGVPLANFGGTITKMLADALEGKPIDDLKQNAKDLWSDFKAGLLHIKEILMEVFGFDKDTKVKDLVTNGVWDLVKTGVRALVDAIPTFAAAWNAIVDIGAQKLQGFADFLSTSKVDTEQIKNLVMGKPMTGPLVHFLNTNIPWSQQWKGYQEDSANKLYDNLVGIANQYYPDDWQKGMKQRVAANQMGTEYSDMARYLIELLYADPKHKGSWNAVLKANPQLPDWGASLNAEEYFEKAAPHILKGNVNLSDMKELAKIKPDEFSGIIEALEKLANGRLNISITTEDKNTGQKKTASMGVGSISNAGGLVTNSYEAAIGNMVLRAQYAVGSR